MPEDVRLTKDDREAIWRAGNNGGWPGVYRAGMAAGEQRVYAALELLAKEQYGPALFDVIRKVQRRLAAAS